MASGDPASYEIIKPILGHLGKLFYVGEKAGMGQTMKVINNMIGITNIYITGEAMQLASKNGIDFDKIASILDVSTGRNFLSQTPSETHDHYQSWARTPEAFRAFVNIVSKDLHLALSLGESVGLNMPLLAKVSASVDASDDHIMNQFLSNGPK